MATNKKPVTCYLSAQLEEELTKYCTNQGLVRYYSREGKNKPQLGSAIAQILEQHFFGDELPEASESEKKSLTSEIGEIKQALQSLAQRVTDLETNSNGLSTGESTTPSSLESNVPSTQSSQGLSNEVSKEQPPKGNGVSTEASKRPNETEPDQSTVPSPVPSTGKVEASYSNGVGTKPSQGLNDTELPEDKQSSVSDDVLSQGLNKPSNQSESTEESQTPSTRPDETETDQSTASSNVPSKEEAELNYSNGVGTESSTGLKDESDNKSDNVPSPALSTEEQQETPSIFSTESQQEENETEQFQDSWDNSDRADQPTPTESSQENDGGLSGWMGEAYLVRWLDQNEIKVGHATLRRDAGKVSENEMGQKEFTRNGAIIRQKTDENNRKKYCCIGFEVSENPNS